MGLDIYFLSQEAGSNKYEKFGYFRKVNSLIEWIEKHVGPVENCKNVEVQKQHLEFLKATLEKLTPTNCFELFPTTKGFFFGSTDYDDWYWKDVNEVKEFIYKTLETFDFEKLKLYFHAWW